MASAMSGGELSPSSLAQLYCHKCRHTWPKQENSEFVCPECNEGFVEEIENLPEVRDVRERNAASIGSYLSRLMEQVAPRRSAEGTSSRSRDRSRSPNESILTRRATSLSDLRVRLNRALRTSQSSSSSSSSSSPPRNLLEEAFEIQISPPRPQRAYLEPPFNFNDLVGQFLDNAPISQSRLNILPIVEITQDHLESQCSICLYEFTLTDLLVRQLTCKHMFHEPCIFPWLRISGTCPVCRALVDRSGPTGGTLSPRSMRQRNFESLVRFMRIRNGQRHRTDNTIEGRNNPEGGHGEGDNPELNPERIDQDFLDRRARFRLPIDFERSRIMSADRSRRTGRVGRIEGLVNHMHDRAFVEQEMARIRGEPMAVVDLTREDSLEEPLTFEDAIAVPVLDPPEPRSNRSITIEDIRFAGMDPFSISDDDDSIIGSDELVADMNSEPSDDSDSSSASSSSFGSEESLIEAPASPDYADAGSGEEESLESLSSSSSSNNEE